LIAGAGSWPIRQAARLAFPAALKAVHPLTESVCDAMLDEFGSLTLADVANRLIAHQTAKGRRVDASLRAARPSLGEPIWDDTSTDYDSPK
jgi:hypothetical protein